MSHFFGLSPGSGVSPHPDLPQGQMDSLLSIISSQRERFRSRNQELEAVSHTLDSSRACVCVCVFNVSVCVVLQENRSVQQTMQALQNELDSLRADNIKLYEKIKFLQSYPSKVRRRVAAWCTAEISRPTLLFFSCHCACRHCVAGWREWRHGDALLLPVWGATGSVCLFQQEGEGKLKAKTKEIPILYTAAIHSPAIVVFHILHILIAWTTSNETNATNAQLDEEKSKQWSCSVMWDHTMQLGRKI